MKKPDVMHWVLVVMVAALAAALILKEREGNIPLATRLATEIENAEINQDFTQLTIYLKGGWRLTMRKDGMKIVTPPQPSEVK